MQVKNQSFIHFLLACAISLSALAVLFTGISSYFRETDPDIAYGINPFNDDARVEYILEGLFRMRPEDSAPHMQEFREAAEQHVRLAPADARGYSLLAETHYRTGDEGLARSLFDQALHYSKTEIHALQRSFEFLARDGDFAAAMERIDLISRRWPSRFQLIAPHLAQMLQSPEAYEKARELLRGNPPWSGRFYRALTGEENGLLIAYRLLMDLSRINKSLPPEAEDTMQRLIRAKQYDLAYRLFLFTQSEEDRKIAGYIFNGSFDVPPGRRPFDWQIRDNASAEAYWTDDASDGGQIRIRFLGKPVKSVGVSQLLYLPPGNYSLQVEYSAAGLVIPRGLFLRLGCVERKVEAARIDIPEERAERKMMEARFEIPAEGCGLYRLGIETALIADSFLYAYRGTIQIHGVKIDRIDA